MAQVLKVIWHKFIINKLKAFNVYCDERSIETSTGVVKRKYKLSFNVIRDIQIYPFFILTSSLTCSKFYAFEIQYSNWDYIGRTLTGKSYLKKNVSYIDVRKMDIISQSELYNKMKRYKQFFLVGKLTSAKRDELKEFCKRVNLTTDVQSRDKGLMLKELTGDDGGNNVDNIINQYKI